MKYALLIITLFTASLARADFNRFGAEFGLGSAEGIYAGPTFKPFDFLRFNADVTTDLVAPGFKGGLTLQPFWGIAPLASVEIGHQFDGNFNTLGGYFGAHSNTLLLNNVDYSYINLQPGIAFGLKNWFMVDFRVGMTYLWSTTQGLQAFLSQQTNQPITTKEVSLNAWVPSVKLGFQILF
jgi:hypothetical protein